MKNLKIGKKLLSTFSAILLVFIATVAIAFYSLDALSDSYTYFYEKPYHISNEVIGMRRNIQAAAKNVMYAMTTADLDKINAYLDEAQSCLDSLTAGVGMLYERSEIDRSIIDRFQSGLKDSEPYKEEVFSLVREKKNAEAVEVYFTGYYPMLAETNSHLLQISDFTTQRGESAYQDAKAHITRTMVTLAAVVAAALVMTALLGLYLTRNLKRPILEIEEAANSLSRGELSGARVHYRSKDELGSLAESMRQTVQVLAAIIGDIGYLMDEMAGGNFNIHTTQEQSYRSEFRPILLSMRKMNNHLSDTMRQIGRSSDLVAGSSQQVSDGAQALSRGSTEQAGSIQELAASINEIAERVRRNAGNAQEARQKVEQTGEQLSGSNEQMQQMVTAMERISDSSGEIAKIIKTIEDIAFQTNILALNAAVEAARAGEAGKGFAVVADEVRALATKSSEASKNTSGLIEKSLSAVRDGMDIAERTAESLSGVVESAKIVTQTIDRISMDSSEQAQAVDQVTQGIDQISAVVQQNSATAEQSAAASEELSGQAQVLKDLVLRFKCKEEAAPAS